jgi:hypothetical protein
MDEHNRSAELEPVGIEPALDPAWVARATSAFVAAGVALRIVRYLTAHPLWWDESMLSANLLDRGFLGLLQPLDYRQVAPFLFLWVEMAVVKVLGFSELTLRLFPCAVAVASMFLFRHVAARIVKGEALLAATALFAVSALPLKFANEVKPYASDLFVALGLLAMAIEWRRRPNQVRWLWGLAVAGPIALAISFPAVFTAGAMSLGLAWMVWKTRRAAAWVPFAAFNVGVGATFLALLRFYKTAPQDHAYFHRDWAPAFPPLDNPVKFAVWFLDINTGNLFAYPEGGPHGLSTLTFLAFAIAAWVLWRKGRRGLLGLFLAPFGLTIVAAAMHRYPYGFSARTMQFVAPTICLFAGLGATIALASVRGTVHRRRAVLGFVLVLGAYGAIRLGHDAYHPYKLAWDVTHRGFARWFWDEKSRNAELVCLKTDFGVEFDPRHWNEAATDNYLCYQKIFSPRHHRGAPPRLDLVSAAHPLRLVFFNEFPIARPSFQPWLADALKSYDLRTTEFYPISGRDDPKRKIWDACYIVYEFVPKAPARAEGTVIGFGPTGAVRR